MTSRSPRSGAAVTQGTVIFLASFGMTGPFRGSAAENDRPSRTTEGPSSITPGFTAGPSSYEVPVPPLLRPGDPALSTPRDSGRRMLAPVSVPHGAGSKRHSNDNRPGSEELPDRPKSGRARR